MELLSDTVVKSVSVCSFVCVGEKVCVLRMALYVSIDRTETGMTCPVAPIH